MRILMLTSEAHPFVKTGGLADAVPALATALHAMGHDVRLILPRYYSIDKTTLNLHNTPIGVPMGEEELWCGIGETTLPGTTVPVYFVDREDLFGREGIYGPDGSQSWPDNPRRYAFLSAAAFQVCRYLQWIPEILHLHDWPTAPAAGLLEHQERDLGFAKTASVVTVHNLGYQGIFDSNARHHFPNQGSFFPPGNVNFLAAGLQHAQRITTVSPTYAQEILEEPMGAGLSALLTPRKDRLSGILNGMDYQEWNPSTDPALENNHYSSRFMGGKKRIKAALQHEMGLPIRPHLPLFGMIARLTEQKGVDLLQSPDSPALQAVREGRAQLVILGSGEQRYEEALRAMAHQFPTQCAVQIAFSGPLSRKIEAGSDFFLMPSRYEPCGLNQMYSLAYGTLPVVRQTGGLADSVLDMAHPDGDGFIFEDYSSEALGKAMERAIQFYHEKTAMKKARKRAMKRRFDWKSSAAEYLQVYQQALADL
ncbi:MAG: glycogen synthase [Spirochaetales bacterium]|nr:glycogen synthase [Spirochaetales bacterium]